MVLFGDGHFLPIANCLRSAAGQAHLIHDAHTLVKVARNKEVLGQYKVQKRFSALIQFLDDIQINGIFHCI